MWHQFSQFCQVLRGYEGKNIDSLPILGGWSVKWTWGISGPRVSVKEGILLFYIVLLPYWNSLQAYYHEIKKKITLFGWKHIKCSSNEL